MRLEQARKLRFRQPVKVPEDRGDAGYQGIVESTDCRTALEHKAHNGASFIWVSVKGPGGRVAIWPSNRLTWV